MVNLEQKLITSLFTFTAGNERKGFILGVGSGIGLRFTKTVLKEDKKKYEGGFHLYKALLLDLKIGTNIKNQCDLYLTCKTDCIYPYSVFIINTANSLGFSYYFKNTSPSIFLNATSGFSLWSYPFNSEWNDRYSGIGFVVSGGLGYEFRKHLSLLLEYQYSRNRNKEQLKFMQITSSGYDVLSSDFNVLTFYTTHSIRITIQYLLY